MEGGEDRKEEEVMEGIKESLGHGGNNVKIEGVPF